MKTGKAANIARRRRLEIRRLSKIPPRLSQGTSVEREGDLGKKCSGCVDYGCISMMGRRRVMEDAVTLVPWGLLPWEYSFFGVYDGHGGEAVTEICRERMHRCLVKKAKDVHTKTESIDWERLMVGSFGELKWEIRRWSSVFRSIGECGSTALVALVGEQNLIVANCGGSKIVLCRDSVAMDLTDDETGNWERMLNPYVNPDPVVTVVERSVNDEFFIMGTDGLFDVVSGEMACKVVKSFQRRQTPAVEGSESESPASRAATFLAELAMAAGSTDNISVIVAFLK